jgi:hypothetical protein
MVRHAPPVVAVLALALAATFVPTRAAIADAAAKLPICRTVRASGGDYNGGGGTTYAVVRIANAASGTCTISGRPWIKLLRLAHPVSVEDLTGSPLAGVAGRRVILRPGQSARAFILIIPGSCDRSRAVSFGIRAVAGWQTRGVAITGTGCNNGSAKIDVGSFQN